MTLKHQIVTEVLLPQNYSDHINQYLSIINQDFVQFTEVNKLKRAVTFYKELLNIGDLLKEFATLPQLHENKKIAVAGSFSAGKSEFISSLFCNKDIHLPTSIEPTTAIPTYIIDSNENAVYAKQFLEGGFVNLTDIDKNIYEKFSHKFLNDVEFNIKSIMPYLCLSTPLTYKNICLLDTPGYNPSSTGGYTNEDNQSAFDFSQKADILIWVVGIDVNGTISKSDIEFLQNIQEKQFKPLYIILNKADLRPLSSIEDIMNNVVELLDDFDIEYEGISAYSSINQQEYAYNKKSLSEFFEEYGKANLQTKEDVVLNKITQIKEMIIEDNKLSKATQMELNKIFDNIYLSLEKAFNAPLLKETKKNKEIEVEPKTQFKLTHIIIILLIIFFLLYIGIF